MNQFDKARLKYEKNRIQQGRELPNVEVAESRQPVVEIQQAPKEKPVKQQHAAFIHVKVVLPDRELIVCLMKPQVYQKRICQWLFRMNYHPKQFI